MKQEEKIKIHVTKRDGHRLVPINDIIAFLYERNQSKLAKELTIRVNEGFEKLDNSFILKENR